jgi:hypothetical protein
LQTVHAACEYRPINPRPSSVSSTAEFQPDFRSTPSFVSDDVA